MRRVLTQPEHSIQCSRYPKPSKNLPSSPTLLYRNVRPLIRLNKTDLNIRCPALIQRRPSDRLVKSLVRLTPSGNDSNPSHVQSHSKSSSYRNPVLLIAASSSIIVRLIPVTSFRSSRDQVGTVHSRHPHFGKRHSHHLDNLVCSVSMHLGTLWRSEEVV